MRMVRGTRLTHYRPPRFGRHRRMQTLRACRSAGVLFMGVALAALCAVHVGAGQADDCTAMMWNGSEPLLPFN
jgi:hypothetical protein